jgi:signal transduction histidine kinase
MLINKYIVDSGEILYYFLDVFCNTIIFLNIFIVLLSNKYSYFSATIAKLVQWLHNATPVLMNAHMFFLSSLRQKISFGYLIVATSILAVSLFTFESLKRVEARIMLSEHISELFETTMEVRRFERNYFLHGQATDLTENAVYLDRLEEMLSNKDFSLLASPEQIKALREMVVRYRQQIVRYSSGHHRDSQEQQVRGTGKDLVSSTEILVKTERYLLQSQLTSFRITLVVIIVGLALFMIALGQMLSRSIVQPLQQMENYVNAISTGKRHTMPLLSKDREIASITQAFNQMLTELELRQKHLLRSEKLASLGILLSGVAHELNNPLSNIWTSCQILLEELDSNDMASQQVLLMQINEQCERANHIVGSLQDFARERHFISEHFLLRELMEQTLRFIKTKIPPGVTVNLDIVDSLYLNANRQRMQQAFINLIQNALDAMPNGGSIEIIAQRRKNMSTTMMPPCEISGEIIGIQISDTGTGMSADCQSHIFDPFFTTKDVGNGMGLGLFIVYQIIEEHKGCITVDSVEGQGTTFLIRLPVSLV